MANELTTTKLSSFLQQPDVNAHLDSLLGERKSKFIMALTALASSSTDLSECEPNSLMTCALTAVALDLDFAPSLGYCWAVPYNDTKRGRKVATFQMGWKGYVQLTLRTKTVEWINVAPVYDNQFIAYDAFNEILTANFNNAPGPKSKVVGYAAGFRTTHGYKKMVYWTVEQVRKHAQQYSKSYRAGADIWKSNFDGMAKKTVLRRVLDGWTETSQQLQQALTKDMAYIERDYTTGQEQINYIDNPERDEAETAKEIFCTREQKTMLLDIVGKDMARQRACAVILQDENITSPSKIPADKFAVLKKRFETELPPEGSAIPVEQEEAPPAPAAAPAQKPAPKPAPAKAPASSGISVTGDEILFSGQHTFAGRPLRDVPERYLRSLLEKPLDETSRYFQKNKANNEIIQAWLDRPEEPDPAPDAGDFSDDYPIDNSGGFDDLPFPLD